MKFSESLKKNRDFGEVYRKGRHHSGQYMTMLVIGNGSGQNYLGVTVSKKVGNAVVRHRVTRLVRESYRLHETEFSRGRSIVVVAKAASAGASYGEIERELLYLAKRHRILDEKDNS